MPDFNAQMRGTVEAMALCEEAATASKYRHENNMRDHPLSLPPYNIRARPISLYDLERAANEALIAFHDVWMRFIDPHAD